jgi:hypothetical protein
VTAGTLNRAVVTNVSDPLGLSRIRFIAPDVLGALESEWAMPTFTQGLPYPPLIGSTVFVAFEGGDADKPVWVAAGVGSTGGGVSITTDSITAPHITADQIDAGTLRVGVLIGNPDFPDARFATAFSGARAEMTNDGFRAYDNLENVVFLADTSGNVAMVGDFQTKTLSTSNARWVDLSVMALTWATVAVQHSSWDVLEADLAVRNILQPTIDISTTDFTDTIFTAAGIPLNFARILMSTGLPYQQTPAYLVTIPFKAQVTSGAVVNATSLFMKPPTLEDQFGVVTGTLALELISAASNSVAPQFRVDALNTSTAVMVLDPPISLQVLNAGSYNSGFPPLVIGSTPGNQLNLDSQGMQAFSVDSLGSRTAALVNLQPSGGTCVVNTNNAGSAASFTSTQHSLQLGPTGASNLRFDPATVLAVNNGAAAVLSLNCGVGVSPPGGSVLISVAGATTQVNGDLAVLGRVESNVMYMSIVTITPSAANTPTSTTVTSLGLLATENYYSLATAQTSAPGTLVTGVATTAPSPTQVTVWVTRTNTTATGVQFSVMADSL